MKKQIVCAVFAVVVMACTETTPPPREGFVEVEGGRIWYQTMGSGNATPLLVMHGGPGSTSCGYQTTLSQLAESRPVILYDQLGSGLSDRPAEGDTTYWNVPRFVDEVVRLREALNLDEVHILGKSWGGALAAAYMLAEKPSGVKSLTLAGPLLDTERWIEDAHYLRSQMPEDLQTDLIAGEESKNYDDHKYQAATDSFYARYMARSGWPPKPNPLCEGIEGNREVYQYMWGPTEFTATGTLLDFDVTDRLHELDLPVLFIAGRYDEARPETMYEYQQLIPGSIVEIVEDAGHSSPRDQPVVFNTAVGNFLASVEAR